MKPSAARERVLDASELLFSDRGYKAVTLRDIANKLGIRQASLYHHFPGGKQELYVEVTERSLVRHAVGLKASIDGADTGLRERLRAAAHWLLDQPPVDLARMVRSDMTELDENDRRRLTQTALRSLLMPIEELFRQSYAREEIRTLPHERLLASSLLSIVEAIQVSQRYAGRDPKRMADDMIDVLLDGLRPR